MGGRIIYFTGKFMIYELRFTNGGGLRSLRVLRVTPPKKMGSNWVKLGSFSFFEKAEIGEIVNVYIVICIFQIGFV